MKEAVSCQKKMMKNGKVVHLKHFSSLTSQWSKVSAQAKKRKNTKKDQFWEPMNLWTNHCTFLFQLRLTLHKVRELKIALKKFHCFSQGQKTTEKECYLQRKEHFSWGKMYFIFPSKCLFTWQLHGLVLGNHQCPYALFPKSYFCYVPSTLWEEM